MKHRIVGTVAGATIVALGLFGCASTAEPAPSTTPSASDAAAPQFSQELYDALPQSVIDSGELKTAGILFPPYAYYKDDGTTIDGLDVDLTSAFSEVLGVDVTFAIAPSVTEVYSGMASGRYDLGITPTSDTAALQETYDFTDWLREYVVFAVQAGNPKKITSLATTCGATMATLQGGSAERILNEQKATCETDGKDALTVNTFPDQTSAILAVQSGRADAAFSSQIPLTYFVEQSDGALELAGQNQENGFPNLLVGTQAPKGNGLAEVMLGVFQSLEDSGAYDALLEKYNITGNAIDEFGVNIGGI